MNRILPVVLFCACFLAALPAAAVRQGIGVYFDQDLLLPLVNEDRDYTMGVGIEFFQEDEGFYPFEYPLKLVARFLGIHEAERSYLLGSVNYTPDDLSASAPLVGDRPYASVLNKRVLADRQKAVGVEVQVGLLGTYLAREIQRKLHRAWRGATGSDQPVTPRGWSNQVSAGGEPTLRLRLARSDLLAENPGHWDLASSADISLGYQTNASLGLAARGGVIASPFWSLPYDPINRGHFVPAFGGDEAYFWVAVRGRVVGYDALLQGQFGDSVLTYDASRIRRLVLDAGSGVTGSWEWLAADRLGQSEDLRAGYGGCRSHALVGWIVPGDAVLIKKLAPGGARIMTRGGLVWLRRQTIQLADAPGPLSRASTVRPSGAWLASRPAGSALACRRSCSIAARACAGSPIRRLRGRSSRSGVGPSRVRASSVLDGAAFCC